MRKSDEASRVGVVLIPGFSLMAFASTVEPLRSANLMRGATLYAWRYLSPEGGMVSSSGGLEVMTAALVSAAPVDFDLVVVCGGLGCERYENAQLANFLRQAVRRGALVGSVSTASFILARAGLLDGRACTVHWDYLDAFKERYPDLDVSSKLFAAADGVLTCAGGTAALDMMLQFLRERHGDDLANLVSDQFIHGALRRAQDDQRMDLRNRIGVAHPLVLKAVETMENAIEAPLRVDALARKLRISTRQLERLFRRTFRCSPTRYYSRLRLEKARKLLRQSTLSVIEIGISCGFVSASHFSRTYREAFGIAPRDDRRQELLRPREGTRNRILE